MKNSLDKIYFITSNFPEKVVSEVEKVCKGGGKLIQLRIKDISEKELLPIALNVKTVCDKYKTTLIINDNIDITLSIKATGVHLGKNDINPILAREKLGYNYIIGGTANTFEDVLMLVEQNVNYIGLGPYRFTKSKKNLSPILGISGIQNIIEKCRDAHINIPIYAIGGITTIDIPKILNTEIYGIALSGEIANSEDIIDLTKTIINTIEKINE